MRPAVAIAVAALITLAAPAEATTSVMRLSGHAWETGGFPGSDAGDELEAVGVVTAVRAPLFWSPGVFSYTWRMSGLVSLGESAVGSVRIVDYAAGELVLNVDALPSNHAYGTFPPNATAPSTFTDGASDYLRGSFDSLMLTYDDTAGSGSLLGEVTFTGGNAFPRLQSADGWSVGAHVGGVSPDGYDLQVNGTVYVAGPLPVEAASWAGIKALHR